MKSFKVIDADVIAELTKDPTKRPQQAIRERLNLPVIKPGKPRRKRGFLSRVWRAIRGG